MFSPEWLSFGGWTVSRKPLSSVVGRPPGPWRLSRWCADRDHRDPYGGGKLHEHRTGANSIILRSPRTRRCPPIAWFGFHTSV